jgi:hypothetical protein
VGKRIYLLYLRVGVVHFLKPGIHMSRLNLSLKPDGVDIGLSTRQARYE